ncbi:MAG: ATP-binding protein, partial [Anaerolineales bacterium]|nr:ATP-binding protein [Anaerolineales bacterium]
MKWTPEQVNVALNAAEGETVEFKEAKRRFSFDELLKYCAAIANEGGGSILLGATDRRPRRVVGTQAFLQPERTRSSLIEQIHLGVSFSEVFHPDGRILVFHVPPRPTGVPIKAKGVYWQREADSLKPMSEDRLRAVFSEMGHDFSADICRSASINDLDLNVIEQFRRRWIAKSGNHALGALSAEQLLSDAEAIVDG